VGCRPGFRQPGGGRGFEGTGWRQLHHPGVVAVVSTREKL